MSNSDNTAAIREAVENYFAIEGTKHEPFEENNVAHAAYKIESKFNHVDVFFHAKRDKLVIRIFLPLKSDEEERSKVAEFLLRANYGLSVGCFDFDFDDGEISYRTSIFCGIKDFSPPTYEQIDYTLFVSLMTIDKYADALAKVLFGLVEPEDAIEDAEDAD